MCARGTAPAVIDSTTTRGLPSPCGHRLLGLAVRRGYLDLRRCSSRTEEQGGRRRWCQRERERVRKEAGGGKCGCQTLASVHPLFYMCASTLLAARKSIFRGGW